MKQRFELFINGRRADLDWGTAPVLFNYTTEELRNPTIVKNSYSQQLRLQGTPANNAIFQAYFRLDAAPSENGFDPSKRVPFEIYRDGGVLTEKGYCKLDGVSRTGAAVQYSVTLYGGLGGFLYSLQNDANGARSLASLTFKDGQGNPVPLEFVINGTTVGQAWRTLNDIGGDFGPIWHILNFAPAYNGIPDKFDAGRALVKAAANGLQTSVDGYTARGGYAVVDLPEDMNEWQVKDLRSYLQRPVISVAALIAAICDPDNNGGYTVDLDATFFNAANPYYSKTWLTLKQLTKLKVPVTHSSADLGSSVDTVEDGTERTLGLRQGQKVITMHVRPDTFLYTVLSSSVTSLYWGSEDQTLVNPRVCNGLMFQAVAYDAAGNAVAGSKVAAVTANANYGQGDTAAQFAANCGFTPVFDDGSEDKYGELVKSNFRISTPGSCYWLGAEMELQIVTEAPVQTVKIFASKVQYTKNGGAAPWERLYQLTNDLNSGVTVTEANFYSTLEYTFTSQADIRSDATVTKEMLLSDTMSPADFLLSYCKRFGLMLRMDAAEKVVHIEQRATHYNGGAGERLKMDISDLVDRSKEMHLTPVPFDVQRFSFAEADAGAGYAADYLARFGRPYGAKRLNTGFEFNADLKELLQGSKFKTVPEVKARDLAFLEIQDPARPAVFLNSGLKYHLFAANNRDTNELDVPAVPSTAQLYYYNETYKTYDAYSRAQLCTGDGKGIDGDGVLLFYQAVGPDSYISDDIDTMYLGNKEKPCWILEGRENAPGTLYRAPLPLFGRHMYAGGVRSIIDRTLDFGTPAEVDIPGVQFVPNCDVYGVFWASYIVDRYSPATKVLTCYVAAAQIPNFGPDALRRFYWIDGALWALNKIENFDLNGTGLTKCEFVQVQDSANYTNFPNA